MVKSETPSAWLIAGVGFLASAIGTAVIIGIFVGSFQADVRALAEQFVSLKEDFKSLTSAVNSLSVATGQLKVQYDAARTAIEQERQERLDAAKGHR